MSYYNDEGYPDPTAYYAMTHIEAEKRKARYRPLVYICSPYSGDVEQNVENARKYCRYAVDKGYVPIAPHLFFPQFMDDNNPDDRNLAMFMDTILLTKCKEVWVFGDRVTDGMKQEIFQASMRKMRIKYQEVKK